MKALVFLSGKSMEIRLIDENQKEEMAEVEQEAPGQIIEDEDDIGVDIESDEDEDDWEFGDDEDADGDETLYESPLDKIDEIIHFNQQLLQLQQNGGTEIFNFLMQSMSPEEQQLLQKTAEAAQQYQQ